MTSSRRILRPSVTPDIALPQICIPRDISQAMPQSKRLHWGFFDGNIILDFVCMSRQPWRKTKHPQNNRKAHFIHSIWTPCTLKFNSIFGLKCLMLTDDVCIKGHISPYLEVSTNNSETPENLTEKVKIIGKFI